MASDQGRGRGSDDDLTAGPPPHSDRPFSDEGMRRIIYGQDRGEGRARDGRSEAFADDTAELEADLRSRRNLVPIVTALAAVFCFGAIVWYAYTWGTGKMTSDELPVVRAEPMPEKVKPEQPGGMVVEHQGIEVLNPGEAGAGTQRVERLLPRPEIPAPPEPLPEAPQTAQAEPQGLQPDSIPAVPQIVEESTADTTESPDLAEEALEGELGEGETGEPAEAESELAEGGIAKPIPKPADGAAGGGDVIAKLLEQQPMETANGENQAPAAAPAADPAGNQVAALTAGDVVLQLSSVKSQAAAATEWKRLTAAHPGLLGDRPLALEQADIQGTTYFRVQTGPFPSRAAAADICAKLKARNQDCLVKQR
ncbi:SPOR domain-containing protein [Pelagibius sp. 7325]|uniref:SPOR domain-containing protein n=1 Tax=Pelagibius sp. 7325 TaxID=3131994 RepID=UPI0030EB264F